ncbi:MAG: peptidylprolyl isomerase [Pyrinomonadaceae bacterium]
MSNLSIFTKRFVVALLAFAAFSIAASAQETEVTVVDEVIAQVNDNVVLLSQVNRELKNATNAYVQQGKTEAEAKALVEKQKGQLIANLINEELLMQRGNEMGLESTVEEKINARLLEYMKQFSMKNLDELYAAMRQQGVDPDTLRANWRKDILREEVFRNMVDAPTYWGLKDDELKDYYNKNIDKFKKPATVTISEIFLSYAGKNPEDVKKKSAELIKQLRSGGDFCAIAKANSDRPDVNENCGKTEALIIDQLDPKFVQPLKDAKVGTVVDAIELPEGLEIIRIDERTKASSDSEFNENLVRNALLQERLPEARKKYLGELYNDAYVKIRENYKNLVTPFLITQKTNDTTASK